MIVRYPLSQRSTEFGINVQRVERERKDGIVSRRAISSQKQIGNNYEMV